MQMRLGSLADKLGVGVARNHVLLNIPIELEKLATAWVVMGLLQHHTFFGHLVVHG